MYFFPSKKAGACPRHKSRRGVETINTFSPLNARALYAMLVLLLLLITPKCIILLWTTPLPWLSRYVLVFDFYASNYKRHLLPSPLPINAYVAQNGVSRPKTGKLVRKIRLFKLAIFLRDRSKFMGQRDREICNGVPPNFSFREQRGHT